MKMRALLACLFIAPLVPLAARAQKPVVDTTVFAKWPVVRDVAISNDGRYAGYSVVIAEPFSAYTSQKVELRDLNGDWKVQLPSAGKVAFSNESRKAIFLKTKDTLTIVTLGTSTADYVSPITAFRLFKQNSNEWLAYQLSSADKTLELRNLATTANFSIRGVKDYVVSDDGGTIAVLTESKADSSASPKQVLSIMHLPDAGQTEIWRGSNAHNVVLDSSGTKSVFSVDTRTATDTATALWYYTKSAATPILLADDRSAGIDRDLQLGNATGFTVDGARVLVELKEKRRKATVPDPGVDIWSYTDAKLQSQQLSEDGGGRPRTYLAVINTDSQRRILRLQQTDDRNAFGQTGDFVLFDLRQGDNGDYNWAVTGQPSYALVNTRTGARRILTLGSARLSPAQKYAMGYDGQWKNVYVYEVATGITRNLTGKLPIPLIDRGVLLEPRLQYRPLQIARWLPNDEAVLIYDRFDIWRIDPSGKKAPVNLTNGFGRRHKIVLRLPGMPSYQSGVNPRCIDIDCRILNAFDQTNKNDGFYRIRADGKGDPESLSMGRYAFYAHSANRLSTMWPPTRARDANVYVLQRESVTESLNYFWTVDFKQFTPVSNVHPEKDYRWPTSELLTYRTLDGHTVQGVLYKPADFDARKTYPLIIHYYEEKSDQLNQFHRPGRAGGELDITWFASHGYLVFLADIYDTMRGNGRDAINSVVAAANYLSGFPYVDGAKIGLQGMSFAGYYTNYLVTHSPRFAAAVSVSGSSDLIGEYGDLWGGPIRGNVSKKEFFENRHYRMNATLWERPDVYIKNSPIFDANRITTPILLVHNKRDGNVSFIQGLEFFTALRRLGKHAWMIQYDSSSHGVDLRDDIDFTVRSTQFFDHYLKGAPAPRWMTQGVPARLKGIDSGLDLDVPGKTPGNGLVMRRNK